MSLSREARHEHLTTSLIRLRQMRAQPKITRASWMSARRS